jgi:hypothetical protein
MTDRRTSSVTLPYRAPAAPDLAAVYDLELLLPPARTSCPECRADLRRPVCERGHIHTGRYASICDRWDCNAEWSKVPIGRFCGPNKRMRYGFLWLWKCREPGTHLHQACKRCEWRGVSLPPEQRT